jgi:hypothetical protein
MAYETLYTRNHARQGWLHQVSPECREWLEGLADHILQHGEPVWLQVNEKVEELFPDDAPTSVNTVKENVRKLVRQRG